MAVQKENLCFAVGAICDGIGGSDHGEIAAGLVLTGIRNWFLRIASLNDLFESDPAVIFAHLLDGAEAWNQDVVRYRKTTGIATGTTMSILMLFGDHYYTVHVGDSRILFFRNGNVLTRLTTDDTVLRNLNGREKYFLTNYMGKSDELVYSTVSGTYSLGDAFFYCSDGFYHRFTEQDAASLYAKLIHEDNPSEKSFWERAEVSKFHMNPKKDNESQWNTEAAVNCMPRNESSLLRALTEIAMEMADRGDHDNISVGMLATV